MNSKAEALGVAVGVADVLGVAVGVAEGLGVAVGEAEADTVSACAARQARRVLAPGRAGCSSRSSRSKERARVMKGKIKESL